MSPTSAFPKVRYLKLLIFLLSVRISSKEGRSKESSVDGRLVEDDGVLLVVTCVASDSDNCVAASRQFFEMKEVHGSGAN